LVVPLSLIPPSASVCAWSISCRIRILFVALIPSFCRLIERRLHGNRVGSNWTITASVMWTPAHLFAVRQQARCSSSALAVWHASVSMLAGRIADEIRR
jgi:hypothetical protein